MISIQLVNTLPTDKIVHSDEPKLYTRAFTENLAEFLGHRL